MRLVSRSSMLPVVVACALALQAGSAAAAIVTYSSQASFLADTGATQATTAYATTGPSASFTNNGIVFTPGPAALNVQVDAFTPLLAGNEIGVSGNEDLNVQLPGTVFALGFDFVEPTDATTNVDPLLRIDSSFAVTLLNGATVVDSFGFNAPNDVAAFVGVHSSLAFDRLQIVEAVGGIDNEYFGQVYTGTTALAPIPLPAALPLFGAALAGLGALGLKRRRRA